MTRKTKGRLNLYRSYNFVDKDPIIDKMRVMFGDVSYGKVSELSGVSYTTLKGWFDGKTRRPQYATVMAAVHAMGYKITYSRDKDNVVDLKRDLKRMVS
jgi:hypothetical protein